MAEFSNPNQQGGQEGRSLMAMMVIFVAVVLGLQLYRAKTTPPPSPTPPIAATQTPSQPAPAASAVTTPQSAAAAPAAHAARAATPSVEASAESTTVVENALYRITFCNRGAQVTSWVLKGPYTDAEGHPLDLVNQQAAKLFGYPLSLYTGDGAKASIASVSRNGSVVTLMAAGNLPADIDGRAIAISGVSDSSYDGTFVVKVTGPNTLTYTQDYGDSGNSTGGTLSTLNGTTGEMLSQALFVPSATGNLATPASLTFKYSNGDVQATKTFTFDQKTYLLHAYVAVTRAGAPVQAMLSWPGGFGDQDDDPRGSGYNNAQFDSDRNGSTEHLAPKKVTDGETLNGPFDWAGVSDPFFAAVFLPESPATATIATLHGTLDVSKEIKRAAMFGSGSAPSKAQDMPILGAALGDAGGPIETRIFVGPKAINVLKSVHAADLRITLEPDLEFGFWGPIAKYLFLSLQAIHAHITARWSGSWGWAIIVLTVFINLLILPFRVKTMHSALKMQRIQPQMDAIKERYKKYKVTDPRRSEMNAEIMQLQKDNGVNMFGGCIPQLITMPLMIAFFYMLPRVVELRLAHWYWLPNLQAADPYHILPIFMVLSQFLVQFYTPSPGVDPQQQKMMAFMMPLFSGYITWTYYSGLALYWSVGNLIGIAQQMVMNRTSLGREMREVAAKRARRKGNQGRK